MFGYFFQEPFRSRCRSAHSYLVVSSEPLPLDLSHRIYMVGSDVEGLAEVAENLSV